MSCIVVKLGGSLITADDCGKPTTVSDLLTGCAQELAESGKQLVLVHGTGTYGKPPAVQFKYLDGHLGFERGDVVSHVSVRLAELELEVLRYLEKGGLSPLRLPASTLFHAQDGQIASTSLDLITELHARGITPVIGGGFVVDTHGFKVCSSDVIATDLAINLGASALVLVTNACGVHQDYGQTEEVYESLSIRDYKQLASLTPADNDVSGGIRDKVLNGLRAAEDGISTFIIDGRIPDNLSSTLHGRMNVGTQLIGDVTQTVSGDGI